jgi:osmoprotectant transport system ATP-binding protein
VSGPAVAFDAVTKRYGDGVAVDAVTLEIAGGSFVALVGTSGAGKSTLLKMINRLVEPDAGRVTIAGEAVTARPAAVLRRAIGYVFQNVGLFPHMDVAANIAITARLGGAMPDVPALLESVGLPAGYAARQPRQLSGGEQQRVGVARALAAGAGLMLMDEPFGALDPVTRATLGESYRALHDRLGLTTIMVTHDMSEALLLAARVLVMAGGRVVGDASPRAILAGEAGPAAAALADVPRRQAARLRALEAE